MKIFSLLCLLLALTGCVRSVDQEMNSENEVEQAKGSEEQLMSNNIEVVSVETGWYGEQRPQIKIKFRNISGDDIKDFIKVKYQFIEDDEVFDEGNEYLHASSDVNWETGISKTKIFRSDYGYPLAGHRHNLRAKVCYEDNSLVWEGNISHKVIYD